MDPASVSDDQTLKCNCCDSDDNQTLKDCDNDCHCYENIDNDLRIFAYELHNYFMARHFCIVKEYPEPIPVTESSEFTEEFGKAVLVYWEVLNEKSKMMLDDDFPRYMERLDNFAAYVTIKIKEMLNESLNGANMTLTHEILMMTAFLFDVYIYCYRKGCSYTNCFPPHFVEFWSELFLTFFYERFSGWKDLREQCKWLSEEYDKTKTEKSTEYFKIAQFNPKYFKNDVNKIPPGGYINLPKLANELSSAESDIDFKIIKIPDSAYWKLISRFHTVGKSSEKTLPSEYRGGIRKREETLDIIFRLTAYQEICEFDKYNCASIFEEKKLDEKSSKKKSKKKRRKNK